MNKIYDDFISSLPLEGKDQYTWSIRLMNITENSKTYFFQGANKGEKNDMILVKQININKDLFKDKEYIIHILRGIIFLFSLINYYYFPKKILGLISKDEEYLYLIIKENNVTLKSLIASKNFNYLENKKLIKWIIYQIVFGLYILHSNNIIHHDIKPSNIVIDENGGIEIIDFDSAIFKNEHSYRFTFIYSSPEILIGNRIIDEKIDMWSLGLVLLELFLKESPFLSNKNIKNSEEQLYFILEKLYGAKKEQYPINDLIDILNGNNNKNIKFNIEQKYLEKIQNKDAIFLLNNLLNFDPKERYTAKQVLESDYLKEFKGLDSFDIKPIKFIIDNDEISKKDLEKKIFIELIKRNIFK